MKNTKVMVAEKESPQKRNSEVEQKDRVVVTYYTDPLCCWSWAFEAPWKQFLEAYGHRVDCRYVMCGMITDWKTFSDPVNSVSAPLQMGPLWMHAAAVTHTTMDYGIWHTDPPASSYPACIAVKKAFLQSVRAGELYLHGVRKAVMNERRNIARPEVLVAVAKELATEHPGVFSLFNFKKLASDVAAREAFRADLQKAAFHKIGRFPTVTFLTGNGRGLAITGYRPFERLKECMEELVIMARAGSV